MNTKTKDIYKKIKNNYNNSNKCNKYNYSYNNNKITNNFKNPPNNLMIKNINMDQVDNTIRMI